MLNLAQIQSQVKLDAATGAMDNVILNTNNLVSISIAYKQLDELGWNIPQTTADVEMHETDNTPVRRLRRAALHRDPRRNGWLLEIGNQPAEFITGTMAQITERAIHLDHLMNGRGRRDGHTYEIAPGDGAISDQDLDKPLPPEYERMLAQAEIQRQAEQRAAALPASVDQTDRLEDWLGYDDQPEPEPAPLSPAAEVGLELKRQFPYLVARIDRAVALVEQGVVEFPHYQTTVDEATGVSSCNCKDHAPHVSSGNQIGILTFLNGKACKHAIARNIHYQLKHQQESAAYRRLIDKLERENQRSERNHEAARRINERRPAAGIGSMPLAWQVR